jgi:hypothetical protein
MEVRGSVSRPGRFPRGRIFLYPVGGSHSWYGRCREEKNLLPLPGIEPRYRGYPARDLITITMLNFYKGGMEEGDVWL